MEELERKIEILKGELRATETLLLLLCSVDPNITDGLSRLTNQARLRFKGANESDRIFIKKLEEYTDLLQSVAGKRYVDQD